MDRHWHLPISGFPGEEFEAALGVFNASNAEEPDEEMKSEHENVTEETSLRRRSVLQMSATTTNDHLRAFVWW